MALRHVLLVDDEDDIRTIAEMSLSALGGLEVTTAGSGIEALQRVTERVPDLILLDVMMPGQDGPTTFEALRAMPGGADVPVIFVTAKVRRHEVEHYLEMGAAGVVSKPFDPMTLADEVRRIYDGVAG